MSTQAEKRVEPSTQGVRPNVQVVKQAGLPVTELIAQEETEPGACGQRMPHCVEGVGERGAWLFFVFVSRKGAREVSAENEQKKKKTRKPLFLSLSLPQSLDLLPLLPLSLTPPQLLMSWSVLTQLLVGGSFALLAL